MTARSLERAVNYKQKGDIELAQRSYKKAVAFYSEALTVSGYTAALTNRALAYTALKKYNEALVDSNSVLAQFSKRDLPVPDENTAPSKSQAAEDNGKSDETVAEKNDPKQRHDKVTVGQKRTALRSSAPFENSCCYAPKTEKIKKASEPWQVGDSVLCSDAPDDKVHYEAKIIGINSDASGHLSYKVHYKGFNVKYDENIAHDDSKKRFMAATDANKKKMKVIIENVI
ncbi:RNA binding activity-knot of a chromodomain-containing protein [Ditylenchus destructor]|nr:RNA binding activity-knot of a chromodomain-containing protein [Ditylenchus destructor]